LVKNFIIIMTKLVRKLDRFIKMVQLFDNIAIDYDGTLIPAPLVG